MGIFNTHESLKGIK